MRRKRKVRIIATIGPSSSDLQILEKLVESGVDIFRLNFSHGTHVEHKQRFDRIRLIQKKTKRNIGILMDLQGPKIRIGNFTNSKIILKKDGYFTFDMKSELGDETRVSLMHPEIFRAVKNDDLMILDDGKIRLTINKCTDRKIQCKVITGGVLSDRKGISFPNTALPISSLTKKDYKDLEYGLSIGIDFVALSFVQRPEDVLEAKEIIKEKACIISKLEKPQAIQNLDKIIDLSDAIMVARGDLGVECPLQEVPILQKKIIQRCRFLDKPVIVATQILESMIDNVTPTRAEVSDIATAVYDGADAVMLSAESAVGKYPIQAVSIMDSTIECIEKENNSIHKKFPINLENSLGDAAHKLAFSTDASAIITMSESVAYYLSYKRTSAKIILITNNINIIGKTIIKWGIHVVIVDKCINSSTNFIKSSQNILKKEGLINEGELVVFCANTLLEKNSEIENFVSIIKI